MWISGSVDANCISVQVDLLRCVFFFERVHVGVSVCVFYCLLGAAGSYVHGLVM